MWCFDGSMGLAQKSNDAPVGAHPRWVVEIPAESSQNHGLLIEVDGWLMLTHPISMGVREASANFSSFSISIHLYPLVNIQKAIEHGPVEIVSFPINNGDFP